MRPIRLNIVGAATSAPVPLDIYTSPFEVTLAIEIVSGAISATVQYTFDNVWAVGYNPATGSWNDHTDLTAKTAKANGTLVSGATAVRLVNADTGTAQLVVIQSGIGG